MVLSLLPKMHHSEINSNLIKGEVRPGGLMVSEDNKLHKETINASTFIGRLHHILNDCNTSTHFSALKRVALSQRKVCMTLDLLIVFLKIFLDSDLCTVILK